MVYKTVSTGAYGRWRIYITVSSQSQSGNYSRVRVRGRLYNDGGSRSFNNFGVYMDIRGEDSWTGSSNIDIPGGGSQYVIDRTFTVGHNSSGYKTVKYSINAGDTGTYNLGNPPRVEASLTLPRIPKVPKAPYNLKRYFYAPDDLKLTWSRPDQMGDAIIEYRVQWDTNSSFSSPSSRDTTSRSLRFDAHINDRIYMRVRARNSVGWGPYSGTVSYNIPDHPGKVSTPSLSYTPPTTVKCSWSAPSSGGASINRYQVRYADNSSFRGATYREYSGGSRSATVSDVEVGKTWYFQVRARNSQGYGSWSNTRSVLVVCGPRVLYNGVWRNTIAYMKVDGKWRNAVPYVKHNGVWRVGGG